ncbi:MAG: acyloxyacyl hydrolase [Bacteroidetes bacterium]|nr:acyloxyacyl hydrolase [Bacteroidota bacterium]
MKKYTKFLFTCFYFLVVLPCNSQKTSFISPPYYIKTAVNSGFIIEHRATMGNLVKGYPTLYEINIAKSTNGSKLWQIENNLPDYGLTFSCIDYKNPAELGYAFIIAPFIDIPLNRIEKQSRVYFRISWGGSFITKPFNVYTNQKNGAIGSYFNQHVQFRWFWKINLGKQLIFEPGISFSHQSNGKYKNPNLGINIASLSAALSFGSKNIKQKMPTVQNCDSLTKTKSKNELLAYTSIGFDQHEVGMNELNCYALALQYQRNLRNTHKFSFGINAFYDQNYQIDYAYLYKTDAQGINKYRASAMIGYSYNIGRLGIGIESGYYFLNTANPDGPIVSRLSLNYYSPIGLVAHLGLRTHFAVAYNFEYGLGYRFYLKR